MISKTHVNQYHQIFSVVLFLSIMPIVCMAKQASPLSVNSMESNVLSADSVASDSISKTRDLKELVVEASNVTRRGNAESYVITKDMRRGSRTAGELLRKINGMHYLPFTEALTYLGSSNVVLLVDSLQKDASYIKRQSPDRFDRIDVVPQPGGKYTGFDVLINFHSKPNYTGFETNVRESIDIMPDGNNGKGNDFAKNFTYLDGTYMFNKLTVTALANWQWSKSGSNEYRSTDYPMSDYSEIQLERDRKDPQNLNRLNNMKVNLAADYKFNPNHKLSFQWQINPWTRKNTYDYLMRVLDHGNEEHVGLHAQSESRNNLSNTFGLNYLGRFGQWNLDLSANYAFNGWRSYYDLDRTDDYHLLYDRKDKTGYFWGGVDVNRWFGEYKWYLGFSNYVYVTDFNEKDYYTGDPVSENTIVNDNLYASVQYVPSRQLFFTFNGGISAYSNKTGDIHVTKVMPRLQGIINWVPTQKFALRASYLMQTGTPSLSQMMDYGQFVNMYKYQEGNPDLKPITTQWASLRLTFWRKLMLYADYQFTNTGVFNIYSAASMTTEDSGKMFYYAAGKYQNGKSNALSIGLNFQQDLSRYFSLYLDGKITHNYASYENYSNKVWTPSASLFLSYNLEKQDVNVALSYSVDGSGYVTPQTYQRVVTDDIMLGVQKNLLNKKLTLALSYFLPVHITKGDWKYRMHSPNMIQTGWGNEQFRKNNMLEFTAVFRFSTGKQVRKVTLQTENANVGSQF